MTAVKDYNDINDTVLFVIPVGGCSVEVRGPKSALVGDGDDIDRDVIQDMLLSAYNEVRFNVMSSTTRAIQIEDTIEDLISVHEGKEGMEQAIKILRKAATAVCRSVGQG